MLVCSNSCRRRSGYYHHNNTKTTIVRKRSRTNTILRRSIETVSNINKKNNKYAPTMVPSGSTATEVTKPLWGTWCQECSCKEFRIHRCWSVPQVIIVCPGCRLKEAMLFENSDTSSVGNDYEDGVMTMRCV